MCAFPGKESRIQVLAGLAQFIQTFGSLLRTPDWQSGPEKLGKSEFRDFTSMEK
jgi:hypothetical protein